MLQGYLGLRKAGVQHAAYDARPLCDGHLQGISGGFFTYTASVSTGLPSVHHARDGAEFGVGLFFGDAVPWFFPFAGAFRSHDYSPIIRDRIDRSSTGHHQERKKENSGSLHT